MEAAAEIFETKAVSYKVDRNTETVIVRFFLRHGWDFRNIRTFFQGIFYP